MWRARSSAAGEVKVRRPLIAGWLTAGWLTAGWLIAPALAPPLARAQALSANEDEHSRSVEGGGATAPTEAEGAPQRDARLVALDHQVLQTLTAREEALAELTALNGRRAALEVSLSDLERELTTRERAIARGVTLRRRLTAARVAEVLLSAEGPLDLKRRELSLQAIFRVGARELKTLRAEHERLARERAALAHTLARLEALTETLEAQVSSLLSLRAEEARLLRGERAVGEVRRGRRAPPTLGLWEDRYQSFQGPHAAQLTGAGVWIRGVLDAPVYAVEDGVVVFVGEVRALGRVIILEHADGLLSLYGAVGGALVAPGERVERQSQVGVVGRAPDGVGLYFELRQGGRPVYPREWVEERPALLSLPAAQPLSDP